jgi:hypothetical protein
VCPLTVSNINHHSFLHPYLMDWSSMAWVNRQNRIIAIWK